MRLKGTMNDWRMSRDSKEGVFKCRGGFTVYIKIHSYRGRTIVSAVKKFKSESEANEYYEQHKNDYSNE